MLHDKIYAAVGLTWLGSLIVEFVAKHFVLAGKIDGPTSASLFVPTLGGGIYGPSAWGHVYIVSQALVWICGLIFWGWTLYRRQH